MTADSLANEVADVLRTSTVTFDIPAITGRLEAQYGLVHVSEMDESDVWRTALEHTID